MFHVRQLLLFKMCQPENYWLLKQIIILFMVGKFE